MTIDTGAPVAEPLLATATPKLKAGALGVVPVVMQSVTHIAPALAIILTIQFNTSEAGLGATYSYLLALLILIVLGIVLTQLAKHLPSAGGYYTYVSRTLHPRAGFLVSWLYFFYSPIFVGVILAAVGSIVHDSLLAQYGVDIPWWALLLAGVALIAALSCLGVQLSVKAMVTLGVAEIGLVVALGLFGIFDPGPGGLNLKAFDPSNTLSGNGLYLAVVFSIFAFTGWEAAAALGEESDNPRKSIPRGIIGSLLIIGVMVVFCSWAYQIGWGTDHIASFSTSTQLPPLVLAHKYWGGAWVLLLLAAINSAIAGGIAYTNVATRMWYAMARSGALPPALGQVHHRYQTPVNAILVEIVLTTTIALVVGFWIGPFQEFVFFGVALTFALVFIYGSANVGVFVFYRRERRAEFNAVLHFVFPLIGTIALIWVGYKTLVPFPASPNNWAPIVVGIWLIVGIVILVVMRSRGREEWLLHAGQVAQEELGAEAEATVRRAPLV